MSEPIRKQEDTRAVYSIPEVAEILGIGRASAYNLAQQKGFPVVRIGRQLKVPKAGLHRWIDNQEN